MSGGRAQRPVRMINVHAEGELGYVVTEGLPDIPGKTIADRLAALNAGDGILRRHLMLAPRANSACSVNLLMPPVDPRADAAFIILQPDRAHASSGSNSICVTTALLETGRVRMKEPETTVVLETAAGLVTARAECKDGKCLRVHLDMVPAFVEALDVPLETDKWGRITADICYGGVFYALVDVESVGLSIRPEHAAALSAIGMELRAAFNEAHDIRHPEIPAIRGIAYVMFRERMAQREIRTATVMPPGRLDRSPCGTGSSAQLAALHARGDIAVGESITTRSVIGSSFEVTLTGTDVVAGRDAVLPRIAGRAWRFGETVIEGDPSDIFADGYAVTDVWGPDAGSLNPS
ncbi:MAG: proline racemase family protein [Pseudomonadota bacterium]|nr:proline racemase family protein [Pseudomonadota bacterium]